MPISLLGWVPFTRRLPVDFRQMRREIPPAIKAMRVVNGNEARLPRLTRIGKIDVRVVWPAGCQIGRMAVAVPDPRVKYDHPRYVARILQILKFRCRAAPDSSGNMPTDKRGAGLGLMVSRQWKARIGRYLENCILGYRQ